MSGGAPVSIPKIGWYSYNTYIHVIDFVILYNYNFNASDSILLKDSIIL